MGKFIDLTGQKFERLIVIERIVNDKYGHAMWLCLCECGNQTIIQGGNLTKYRTKSCGCLHKEIVTKHGHNCKNKISKTYITWYGMIARCTNPNCKAYKYYGGRGIKVCEKWLKFEDFLQDMGEKPEGLSIDRIDNDKGYYKENCRWATRKEQNRNYRQNILITINGITKCLIEWCEDRKLNYRTVCSRLQRGWTPEEALELTPRGKNVS